MFRLMSDKLDRKRNIGNFFRDTLDTHHFPQALQDSSDSILGTRFYFKLKIFAEILKRLH